MGDEEGFDSAFDGAEFDEHEAEEAEDVPIDGLRIVFDDELPDESRRVVEVGTIQVGCVMRGHKLKKHAVGTSAKPAFVFSNIPLHTVRATVDFLSGHTKNLDAVGVPDVLQLYAAAKMIGSEIMIQACVDRVWALRDVWITEGDDSMPLETECAWMYLVMSETEDP